MRQATIRCKTARNRWLLIAVRWITLTVTPAREKKSLTMIHLSNSLASKKFPQLGMEAPSKASIRNAFDLAPAGVESREASIFQCVTLRRPGNLDIGGFAIVVK